MSVTVRLFSERELKQIEGRDGSQETNRLMTVLFNKDSYSAREVRTLAKIRDLRRIFIVEVYPDFDRIYATDTNALMWFLSKEYQHGTEVEILEEVITYINRSTWTIAPRD